MKNWPLPSTIRRIFPTIVPKAGEQSGSLFLREHDILTADKPECGFVNENRLPMVFSPLMGSISTNAWVGGGLLASYNPSPTHEIW